VLYERSAAELREYDENQTHLPQRWLAVHNGAPVRAVTAWLRPDERMFLSFVRPLAATYRWQVLDACLTLCIVALTRYRVNYVA
jgi:hypothetical protein